jgi:threonylcarbamoyladenosine tRNA methylthiotransferase MtaB
MDSRGFHTITLGCKLNQFDSAAIEGELGRRGYHPVADASRAAVVVVNTCTVTHKADAEARRLIRAARRDNPHCRLLVTGCYAELEARRLSAIDGVDRVFGNRDKARLGPILDELGLGFEAPTAAGATPSGGDRGCDGALGLPAALHFGERSRALLKIQEGCRLSCSYCIIPRVRGPSRSVPPWEVEAALAGIRRSGFFEIVLTGVNTGDYGRDLDPPTNLAALLRRLLQGLGDGRLRLNSLEPLTVTDEIIGLLADEPRLASHLQIPLQSGSAPLLRKMRRNYRLDAYLERLERLRAAVPLIGLGADVIVGFPGETDARFEETYAFVAGSPLNYLHVFSWSPRPGTPAADLPDRVDGPTVRARSARLRELGSELSWRFRKSLEGRTLDAVLLGGRTPGAESSALTGNFVEVRLGTYADAPGRIIRVRVERATREETTATIRNTPN